MFYICINNTSHASGCFTPMRNLRGFFLPKISLMKYNKPPLDFENQILLLKQRGLIIEDELRAKKYLNNVGYFRLTGYMYHLQKQDGSHFFQEGTTFNDVVAHYQFDKKLRTLMLEYIERIEVALRAKLTDKFSLNHGFYWYTNYDLYLDKGVFDVVNEDVKRYFEEPQEQYLRAFKFKYSSESLPPSNMAMEVLSFGKLSKLFQAVVNSEEKGEISKEFGLPSTILATWFMRITMVRNICAHHSRLWNRRLTASPPVIPTRKKNKFPGTVPADFGKSVYGVIAMLNRLLEGINPGNSFVDRVISVIKSYPNINVKYMGFPEDWEQNPAWKNSYECEK